MDLQTYISSDTAKANGIDNQPPKDIEANCLSFLQLAVKPLEDLFFPKAIHFHSGYRCLALNTLLKGNPHSDHMKGQALDFVVDGVKLEDVYQEIQESSIQFKQLLLEGKPLRGQWCHLAYEVALPPEKQKRQALRLPNA